MKKKFTLIMYFLTFSAVFSQENTTSKPEDTEVWSPKPPIVIPSNESRAPSDAIVLLDGSSLSKWESTKDASGPKWILNSDSSMTILPGTGSIQTKEKFGDVQLHIEWKSPIELEKTGQNRGNSGVFLQKRYEVQVLDNNSNDTYSNGQVASIYKQSIPLAMASNKTGEWNSYDIIFHAPKFDPQGNRIKKGTITVLHNGILVQDHYELEGTTEYIGQPKKVAHGEDSLELQDHGSEVSYRNIWLRKLNE
ncbi:3-keto-disaccharide hydrolase [Namhaeicola litoreus]|uniref:DUF1080 domain-containing protein n=1 Tax=Namhaeicola litoreus TaxID=1052145 RepID=A0ABW3Y4I4_9FLAO